MLRVTIELVPFGDESRSKKIAEMVIANDASQGFDVGNYEVWLKDNLFETTPRFGRVFNFQRNQSPWKLLKECVNSVFNETHTPSKTKDSLSKRLRGRFRWL